MGGIGAPRAIGDLRGDGGLLEISVIIEDAAEGCLQMVEGGEFRVA